MPLSGECLTSAPSGYAAFTTRERLSTSLGLGSGKRHVFMNGAASLISDHGPAKLMHNGQTRKAAAVKLSFRTASPFHIDRDLHLSRVRTNSHNRR